MRNFTALAVREHLESQVSGEAGAPDLTENELDLVRYVVAGQYDWKAFLDRQDQEHTSRSAETGAMHREDEPSEQRHASGERENDPVDDAAPARERQTLELRDAR